MDPTAQAATQSFSTQSKPSGFSRSDLLNDKHLYSIGQAAQYLNVSIDTIRRWEKKGLITAVRSAGNLRRFTKKELEGFKKESENQDVMLPISEAAKELGVSIQTLRRWDKSGRMKAHRDNQGQRVYPKKLLRTLLKGHMMLPTDFDPAKDVADKDVAVSMPPLMQANATIPATHTSKAASPPMVSEKTATSSQTDNTNTQVNRSTKPSLNRNTISYMPTGVRNPRPDYFGRSHTPVIDPPKVPQSNVPQQNANTQSHNNEELIKQMPLYSAPTSNFPPSTTTLVVNETRIDTNANTAFTHADILPDELDEPKINQTQSTHHGAQQNQHQQQQSDNTDIKRLIASSKEELVSQIASMIDTKIADALHSYATTHASADPDISGILAVIEDQLSHKLTKITTDINSTIIQQIETTLATKNRDQQGSTPVDTQQLINDVKSQLKLQLDESLNAKLQNALEKLPKSPESSPVDTNKLTADLEITVLRHIEESLSGKIQQALEKMPKPETPQSLDPQAIESLKNDLKNQLKQQLDDSLSAKIQNALSTLPKPEATVSSILSVIKLSSEAVVSAAEFGDNGTLVKPQIEEHGENPAGTATLPKGSVKMVIKTKAAVKNCLVLITPITAATQPLCTPIVVENEGFAVTIAAPQPHDVTFYWFIVKTEKA